MGRKFLDFIGTVLLIIGFFLAFLPHAAHIALGLESSTSHTTHVIYGMILVVISLALLIYNNDALRLPWKR